MKKVIFTICCILMHSLGVNACGGIVVQGNSGADYCLSEYKMNWYSAYAWCEAQRMKLIDMNSVCKSYNSCAEFKFSADKENNIPSGDNSYIWAWTSTSSSSAKAYRVSLKSQSGGIAAMDYSSFQYDRALCH